LVHSLGIGAHASILSNQGYRTDAG
jgi:hypothetical protein